MSKRTLSLIVILVIITAGLTALALAPKKATAPISTTNTSAPAKVNQIAALTLSPNPLVIASSSGAINAVVNTNGAGITAVQLEISYNPKMLGQVDVAPGSFFVRPVVLLKKVDSVAGRISYAIGISPSDTPVNGTGTIATITFSRVQTGQTTIDFLPKTLVTAEGESASVLKSSQGASVVFTTVTSGTGQKQATQSSLPTTPQQ